jgi:hypothetical protein
MTSPQAENGYIKLYRSLKSKGYYRDSEYVHLWVHLLMKASYEDREFLFGGKLHQLKPGQFITGRNSLVVETGINRSKIERILKCFEIEQQIEQQKTNKFRIISICNWSKYQICEQQDEQQVSIQRATSEHPVSTNKKDKKEKKEKKNNAGAFFLPEWIPKEPWEAYLAMRVKIRRPLTDYQMAVDKLRKIMNTGGGATAADILNQSVFNSWQGLFPLKPEGGNGGNGGQGQKEYVPEPRPEESEEVRQQRLEKIRAFTESISNGGRINA